MSLSSDNEPVFELVEEEDAAVAEDTPATDVDQDEE